MRLYRAILGALRTNTYLIITDSHCVIIDPAVRSIAYSSFLSKQCESRQIWALLTHNHFDHTGGASHLKSRLGTYIAMNPLDEVLSNINPYMAKALHADREYDDLPGIDVYLTDGYELNIGEDLLRAVHTPGHTPGHTVFLLVKERKLFSGDLLFKYGYGRCDLPFSNCEDLSKSIEKIMNMMERGAKAYPGHGPPFVLR